MRVTDIDRAVNRQYGEVIERLEADGGEIREARQAALRNSPNLDDVPPARDGLEDRLERAYALHVAALVVYRLALQRGNVSPEIESAHDTALRFMRDLRNGDLPHQEG